MNTVHCKINFPKKKIFIKLKKIKSNLIKFSNNEIFKNKIFVDQNDLNRG